MNTLDVKQLVSVLEELGSTCDLEVLNAAAIARMLVEDAGLTWEQVLGVRVEVPETVICLPDERTLSSLEPLQPLLGPPHKAPRA